MNYQETVVEWMFSFKQYFFCGLLFLCSTLSHSQQGKITAGKFGSAEPSESGKLKTPYFLGNRTPVENPQPTNECNEYGIITVKVIVDSKGNTIEVPSIATPTSTKSSCIFEAAKAAALKTKWSPVATLENQIGKITYSFKRVGN